MELNEYQKVAARTHVSPKGHVEDLVVALLGLAGETGSLLSEYKKNYREGDAYRLFKDRLQEELGDVLWYLADIARQQGILLEEIALSNLRKTQDWWLSDSLNGEFLLPGLRQRYFDEDFQPNERLPRKATFLFKESPDPVNPRVIIVMDGKQNYGDPLTDNTFYKDGYRFHDVFHLAYATFLNWSPATRKNLNCKRRSNAEVDENEDGGRAFVIEEAVSALVFEYARGHSFFDGVDAIDWDLLRIILQLTKPFEVSRCALPEWQRAILAGYRAWRPLYENKGGIIEIDSELGLFEYREA